MSNIIILGSGYVGLVTAMGLKSYGNNVICIDNDIEKVMKLRQGISPIYEKNLDLSGIVFESDVPEFMEIYIQEADFIFLCIGTPSGQDGSCDTNNLFEAVKNFAPLLKKYTVIVNKSTVPVGTCFKIKDLIKSKTDCPFDIVSNPEFLKEGSALRDFLYPDRIIIGVENELAENNMLQLYRKSKTKRITFMDILSAELTKYAANSMLATRISFMNELSLLCDKIGADINQVKKGIGSDSRIGDKFLNAGIGYGGSCFPKDIDALLHTFYKNGINNKILKAVRDVNYEQHKYFMQKIYNHFPDCKRGLKIAIWGLAFKPDTDDIRCAPAIKIIEELLFFHCDITVYDPVVKDIGIKRIKYSGVTEVLEHSDCLLVLTEWDEFRLADMKTVKTFMKTPVIFDGRNIYDKKEMENLGFTYYGMGV